jgi:N-methylhydantoinase B
VVDYRVRANGCFFTCAYTRNRHLPWPLAGAHEGSPNYAEVIRRDGSVEQYAVVTALEVNAGDIIRIHTGNGGGHGNPAHRPHELVADDIANGLLTPERANEVYGFEQP